MHLLAQQFHCVTMDVLDVKSLVHTSVMVRSVERVPFSRFVFVIICNVRAIPTYGVLPTL